MKQTGIICCLILLFGHSLSFAEEVPFSRPYFSDLSGYHATGEGESENREEALRLAKSAAIKRIFSEIGKDPLFQEMFIATFPQFIIQEATEADNRETGYFARVQLVIDQNAVLMLDEQYIRVVEEILNKGEGTLEKAEQLIREAETSELNLRMSEAMLLYKTAEVHCQDITELLKNISAASVHSDNGNNVLVLKKLNESLKLRAGEGVARLTQLEQELEKDSALEELVNTLELILTEVSTIETVAGKHADDQPFYDLPKSVLQNIRIDLENALEKTAAIDQKLRILTTQIPADRLLLKEKVSISLSNLDRLMAKLETMRKDVIREIRYPRLVRQQHAQNWKKFAAGTGKVVKYIFLHQPLDVLTLRYHPGIQWPVDGNLLFTNNLDLYIRTERAFNVGFWIKVQFNHKARELLNDALLRYSSQELAMGYFRDKFLFGAGFTWDWNREIAGAAGEEERSLHLYFGGVDPQRNRAGWLLSFSYQFPHFVSPFVPAYQLNAGMDLLLRLEDILLVETSLSSGTIQNSPAGAEGPGPENYQYSFHWQLGLGLRMPRPVTWGVYFDHETRGPLKANSASLGPTEQYQYWGAFVEYSF